MIAIGKTRFGIPIWKNPRRYFGGIPSSRDCSGIVFPSVLRRLYIQVKCYTGNSSANQCFHGNGSTMTKSMPSKKKVANFGLANGRNTATINKRTKNMGNFQRKSSDLEITAVMRLHLFLLTTLEGNSSVLKCKYTTRCLRH